MDSFERIITLLLEDDNYWVRQSHKVNLTKGEKRATGKPSIPRPEIDIIALDFAKNHLLVFEVKSFLDSPGVRYDELAVEYKDGTRGGYKLFTNTSYRKIVLTRMRTDLIDLGLIDRHTSIQLGLAAGHVYGNQSDAIRNYFEDRGWLFWSPQEIRSKIAQLAEVGYENDPIIVTAKVLLKNLT